MGYTMESTAPRTQDKREDRPQLPDNEIRVSFKTDVSGAVERIEKAFEKFDHVKLSGINSGISKLIVILEITKVKLENLHQINLVETLTGESTDGSDRPRFSTAYRAELHKAKPAAIPKGYFYQAPYSKEHIEAVKAVKVNTNTDNNEDRPRGEFRGRGGFRGGRGGEGFRGGRGGEGRGGFRGGRGGNGEGFVQRGGFEGSSRGGERGRGEFRGRGRGGFRGGNRGGEGEGFRGGFRGGNRGGEGERGGFRGNSRGGDAPQDRPQTA